MSRPPNDAGAGSGRLPSAESQRGLLESVITSSLVLVFEMDPGDLAIRFVSPNVTRVLGYPVEEVVGVPFWWADRLHPDEREEILALLARDVQDGATSAERDFRFRHADGGHRWFHASVQLLATNGGGPTVVGYAVDVTDRKTVEEQYRRLVEQLPVVVYTESAERRDHLLYLSPQYEALLGYSREQRLSDDTLWERSLHPEDRPWVAGEARRVFDSGDPFRAEYRMLSKHGETIWVREEATLLRDEDGGRLAWQGVLLDVSDRRRAEEALRRSYEALRRTDRQRRELIDRLVRVQEEERTRIAEDIHDDSIQVMTAVGLQLEAVRRRLDEPAHVALFEKLGRTVEDSIRRLRHLIFDLHPRTLEHEGLAAAIRSHLERFADRVPADARVEGDLPDGETLEIRTTLYRIALEAIANVRKHARATRLVVTLGGTTDTLFLRVADDGVGFDAESLTRTRGHLGLSSMRERAELLGGTLAIRSGEGSGTEVEARVPRNVPSGTAVRRGR